MKAEICIQVTNRQGSVVASACGCGRTVLEFEHVYEEGDSIIIECSQTPGMFRLCLDDHVKDGVVWLSGHRMEYPIPLGAAHEAYAPEAFLGKAHVITADVLEIIPGAYGRISENPLDRRGETTYYPHCTANAETRGEAVFAARNVIDGSLENSSHGQWPYTSWGEDENPHAEIKIDFGRPVTVDAMALLIRADFPHDNYWERVSAVFSDGSTLTLQMKKTQKLQRFNFPERTITWVKLKDFVRSDEPSPFPALTAWEVYGWYAKTARETEVV